MLIPVARQFVRLAAPILIAQSASKRFFALRASATSERKIPIAFGDRPATSAAVHIVQAGSVAPENAAAVVLLMPGALGSAWTDFRPQLESLPARLPADWSVVAWDPPGYGKSTDTQRDFAVDFYERDAAAAASLLQTLGCRRNFALGWSDGGITAMMLAARWPRLCERLVVWGANSYVLDEELSIYEGIRDVNKWSAKMREPLEKLYGVEGFARLWGQWIDGLTQIVSQRQGDICKADLSRIECPTLVVHGRKDPMIAAEHVPHLLQNVRNSRLFEFAEGKHNVHLRYADEFNRVVAEFLRATGEGAPNATT